ncbi:uncharacterized protein LOC134259212 [Saccostrea cucullata]|uniref:uncharacterized protein LOC134259212 n=1 Tax=Saccostrea cuccullata TaxID=36930 RepID=UPI002ED0C907
MKKGVTKQREVKKCSQCQGKPEFYCKTCIQNLCATCEGKHVIDLDTKYHDVVAYRAKAGDFIIPEKCEIHPHKIYKSWCHSCEQPIRITCRGHQNHKMLDIRLVYKTSRQKYREKIIHIKSDLLPYDKVIMDWLKTCVNADIETLKVDVSSSKQSIIEKAQRLKDRMDANLSKSVIRIDNYIKCIMEQRKEQTIKKIISIIQKYEHTYELSANMPVQFLLSFKKISIPNRLEIKDSFAIIFHEKIKTLDVNEFLFNCKVVERQKRRVESGQMLQLMSKPVLQKYVPLKKLPCACHISCVTSEKVWVSFNNNIMLINIEGDILCHVIDVIDTFTYGVHCVNKDDDMIYIDRNHCISVISSDHTSRDILVRKPELWTPLCIYSSPFTGDLLVGMGTGYEEKSLKYTNTKVSRYNTLGHNIQTIQYNDTGENLYYHPTYITENGNRDIVMSDFWCIVVTDHNGRHRFTYTGHPSLPVDKFTPYGICTDALLNILVCDLHHTAVHLIDKDGQFLSYLLSEE